MIVYTSKDSILQIPKGLGNFSTAGSADVEPLSGSVIELSATTVTLSGAVETLNESVDSQGDAIADLLLDSDALDTRVSGNTADIAALSGAVETNALGIQNLENYTQNELAPAIGGIGADLASLSGRVDTLSSSTVTGLETAQNAANSANTLASSAYTLADSAYTRADEAYNLAESLTGETGGPEVVLLNKLTEQERIALYNTITSYYDQSTASFTSAWTEDLYAFYIDLREHNDQDQYQLNDQYEGFFPMRVTRVHPTDYGGAVFFTGINGDRYGNGRVVNIRFVINYEGQVDKGTWWNIPVNIGTTCVYVGPNGEYWGHRTADILYSEGDIFKIAVKGCTESFSEEWGFGSFVYARRNDTGSGWYYQWSLIVPTNTGVMKGVWHCDESNGGSMGEVSTYVLDSWTAV